MSRNEGYAICDLIDTLPTLAETIDIYKLRAHKSLGQNFILNLQIAKKIVGTVENLHACPVIEIGPGPGGLTRALLKCGAPKVFAIEYDRRAIEALEPLRQASQGRLDVIHADALKFDLQSIAHGSEIKVVANLPYNIATALLLKWLDSNSRITSFTLMFQREVAQRITASPGNYNYSRLTVIVQWLMQAKILFHLPASVFTPAPKVTSSVIKLLPRVLTNDQQSLTEPLKKILFVAFGQRRKMLRTTLKKIWPDAEKILSLQSINPTRRPETLTIMEYENLARILRRDCELGLQNLNS